MMFVASMSRSFHPTRRLSIQRLEDRRLMAADIDLDNGVLSIEGTNDEDKITIEVSSTNPNEVIATITDRHNNLIEQEDYRLDRIDHIVVNALGGDDNISNWTNITSEMNGGAGFNMFLGGRNNDLIIGGDDGNVFLGRAGDDTLVGGLGNDTYHFDWFAGGANLGHDTIVEAANSGVDQVAFLEFHTSLMIDISSTAQQLISPGILALTISSDTAIEQVWGTPYAQNNITGNARDNYLLGGALADTIDGGAGDDMIDGRDGFDHIHGGDGNDTIRGGRGGDVIHGGAGDDELHGEEGRDWLFGELGNDWIDGGDGIDNIHGGADHDTLLGGSGNDILFGNGGNDMLSGNAGNDWLDGGADNDRLSGGDGFDRLFGRDGNDWLDGGYDACADELWGGEGYDMFVEYWLYDGTHTLLERDQVMDAGEPGPERFHRSYILTPKIDIPLLELR